MPKVTDAHLAARREQIIEAAMTRFAEGGFHSTGMAEVIAATGLSAGAVYRYFPSKEALIRAIVEERVLSAAAAAFERILDVAQGAYAKMRGYLAAVARRAQEHGRMPADADPDEVAKTLLSLVMGYLIQRLIMGDVDRESYTTALRALTALGMPAASTS